MEPLSEWHYAIPLPIFYDPNFVSLSWCRTRKEVATLVSEGGIAGC